MFKIKQGFTIIELLISIMIIGILGGIGYKQYTKAIMKANATATLSQLQQLEAGMAKYYADTGTMPTSLVFLFEAPKATVDIPADSGGGTVSFTDEDGDLFGDLDSTPLPLDEIANYWGGPYIEKMQFANAGTALLSSTIPCTGSGDIGELGTKFGTNVCVKSKLGGNICVGASAAGVDYHNVFLLTGLDVNMAEIMFKVANKKKLKSNFQEVIDGSSEDKFGIGKGSDYAPGTGCAIYRYYQNQLK